MRVKFLKSYFRYKAGDTAQITDVEEYKKLIKEGVAEMTKDMTADDFKSNEVRDGNSGKLRTN